MTQRSQNHFLPCYSRRHGGFERKSNFLEVIKLTFADTAQVSKTGFCDSEAQILETTILVGFFKLRLSLAAKF